MHEFEPWFCKEILMRNNCQLPSSKLRSISIVQPDLHGGEYEKDKKEKFRPISLR